ncbi:hypothetical protein [Niabella drilacis]|uniref:DUF1440 domain-containing protein n=1 Tax=Niabella drilacis (strain DSM 25811 / CCM 8410 / CCUG 62505 / LMG 26954 / E90) TaxID=1285928 RepID=A0A1G6L988_NIADE|nr:hypothetical protein [Niabella drilacis]SDC39647.1 hypothetical protein SAMN04487894_102262 [Niabella drilacis]
MKKNSTVIAKAGFLVGTLDLLSAFLHYYIVTGKDPLFILKYITSALLGPAAFSGGAEMYVTGLLLHYLVAFSFTVFFFWLYPRLKILGKNRVATGIFYGLFIWTVMNLIMVPLSRIGKFPGSASGVLINAAILILAIGLPLSFIASRYYRNGKRLRI